MSSNYDYDDPPERDGRGFHASQDEGKLAVCLPFDNNKYHDGKVPCQLLAATYGVAKLTFCVKDASGMLWTVSKSQIKSLMELGHYVWAESETPVLATGEVLPSLVIRCCESRRDYQPSCQTIYSPSNPIRNLGVFNDHIKYSGRCRKYYEDGRIGVSRNLSTVHSAKDRTDLDEASDRALEEARARARGF